MVLVVAEWTTTEDKEEEFLKTALKLVKNSKTEDGCIEYDLYKNDEPYSYTFGELWEDEKALDNHGRHLTSKYLIGILSLIAKSNVKILNKVER